MVRNGRRHDERGRSKERVQMVTYDARRHHARRHHTRRHHVGTGLAIGAGDVMMVHWTQRSVWGLRLEMDAVVGRSRVLIVSELLSHLQVRCWLLPWKLDRLVLRRVCVETVEWCGVVVDEDVVDACRGGTASRVVVDLSARWGSSSRRGGSHRQRLVILAAVDTFPDLAVRKVARDSVGRWRSASLLECVAAFMKFLFRRGTDRNPSVPLRFAVALAFPIGRFHIGWLRVTTFGVCKVGWGT